MHTFLYIIAVAFAGIYVLSIIAAAGSLIYEHFKKPVEDGHTRAEKREAWGHPMR
jgi:hypothetical protein